MTTVLLVRHGETDWNLERRWQGHADPPLNTNGRDQARHLGRSLADIAIDAVYASDLRRAAETAELIVEGRGLPIVADPDLREIDVGEWSGLTTDEIQSQFAEAFARHSAGGDGWVHGEPHAAMSDRIVGAVARIAAAHPDETVLCVLHGGTIRALLAHAAEIELGEYRRTQHGPANGSVAKIAVEGRRFRKID